MTSGCHRRSGRRRWLFEGADMRLRPMMRPYIVTGQWDHERSTPRHSRWRCAGWRWQGSCGSAARLLVDLLLDFMDAAGGQGARFSFDSAISSFFASSAVKPATAPALRCGGCAPVQFVFLAGALVFPISFDFSICCSRRADSAHEPRPTGTAIAVSFFVRYAARSVDLLAPLADLTVEIVAQA